jgi:hypothetical protein
MTHFPSARDFGWPASKFDTTNIRLARGTKFKGAGVSAGADTGHLLYPGLLRYIPVDGLLSVTAGNRRERLSWPKRYSEVERRFSGSGALCRNSSGKPIRLEQAKVTEDREPVHGKCYVEMIEGK